MVAKTMREQLEESFEKADEEAKGEEARGSEEDTEESLRDSIESAQGDEDTPVVDEQPDGEGDDEDEDGQSVSSNAEKLEAEETPPDTKEQPLQEDDSKPPVSWKPAIREHWGKLPADVKAEINRREADIQKGLQQASGYRKVAEEYLNTVKPFQPLMQSMGASPAQAIQTVMGTVAQLSSGTKSQKAEIVSKLIQDYGVDIETLDTVLSGQELPDDPNSHIMSALDEKLKPVYDFMGNVSGYEEQQNTQVMEQATTELQNFISDPKNDFIEDVRQGMADYLDVAAKNGRKMTLAEAYNRACQDDPEISKIIQQRQAARRASPTGDDLQRKRRAASSVRGNQTNSGGGSSGSMSLRDSIAAQFDEVDER